MYYKEMFREKDCVKSSVMSHYETEVKFPHKGNGVNVLVYDLTSHWNALCNHKQLSLRCLLYVKILVVSSMIRKDPSMPFVKYRFI